MHSKLNSIWLDWRAKVPNGVPNPSNDYHLVLLKELCLSKGVDSDIIDNVMLVLEEVDGKKIKWTDKDGQAKETSLDTIKQYQYDKDFKSNKNKQLAVKAAGLDDKDKNGNEPDDQSNQSTIKSDPFEKGDEDQKDVDAKSDSKAKRKSLFDKDSSKLTPEEKSTLRKEDHNNTDGALNYTKAQWKIDSKKKGEKGVGLGTAESRAGEAAVHQSLRWLKEGKDEEFIRNELMKIASKKDTYLDKEWVEAAIQSSNFISETYGLDNIEEIVWDTPAGRHLINVKKHGTSSDMFIKLESGKRVGISLKKDTNVFLMNGGAATQIKKMKKILEAAGVDQSILDAFDEQTNPDIHRKQREKAMDRTSSAMKGNPDVVKQIMDKYEGNSQLQKEDFDSETKYAPFIDNLDHIFETLPEEDEVIAYLKEKYPDVAKNINKDNLKKFIHKIAKNEPIRSTLPELYDDARQSDIDYTRRFSEFFKNNPDAQRGLRVTVLHGMHFEDALFNGENPNLDDFVTVYGKEKKDLNVKFITDTFGVSDLYEKWQNERNPKKKGEIKKQILKQAEESIIIDHEDGKRQGEIRIKDRKNEKGKGLHIFSFGTRSKPLGGAPGLEMGQTTFMGNSIIEGTTDVSKWDDKRKNKWKRQRIKELNSNLEYATRDEKISIEEELKYIESL